MKFRSKSALGWTWNSDCMCGMNGRFKIDSKAYKIRTFWIKSQERIMCKSALGWTWNKDCMRGMNGLFVGPC